MKELTFGLIEKVPCPNTIDLWMKKCGKHDIDQAPKELEGQDYAVVTDECMMIAGQKSLPTIAIPASHNGRPIQQEDIRIVGINVSDSWTAKSVSEALANDIAKVGHAPKYAITDNDHKMKNAISLLDITRIHDISHTLAMFMERTYGKDPDFVEFNSLMADCKRKNCMNRTAYLQSPSQRTKARFMNLSEWVKWADTMLLINEDLQPEEKEVFSFLPQYATFIHEMKDVVSSIRYIEKTMKNEGLSKDSVSKCKDRIVSHVMCGNARMQKVGQMILDFLDDESAILQDADVLNNSTDILESLFGVHKYIQSPNSLNGVTCIVLHLPVLFRMSAKEASRNYDVKERLCKVKVLDIQHWKEENLMENLVAKRVRLMQKAS